jgi:hypothetical protein
MSIVNHAHIFIDPDFVRFIFYIDFSKFKIINLFIFSLAFLAFWHLIGDSSFLRQLADSFGMTSQLYYRREEMAIRTSELPSLPLLPNV